MNIKRFSQGILFGGLLAASYVLLTTEKSGESYRSQIKAYIQNIQDKARLVGEDISKLSDNLNYLQDVAVPQAEEFQSDVQVIVQDFQEDIEPRQKRIQKQVKKLQSHQL